MTGKEILEEVRQSCHDYLDYLAQTPEKGCHRVELAEETPRFVGETAVLMLSEPTSSTDFLRLRKNGYQISPDKIKFEANCPKHHALTVRDRFGLLASGRKENLFLEVDKTAPAKNFLAWADNATYLGLPHPSREPAPAGLLTGMTRDQIYAVHCCLDNYLSYIWACPGSGGIQKVVAESAMAEMHDARRILITAPDDTALDNALICLIREMEVWGIQPKSFLRLGVPSEDLRVEYPDACENSLAELRAQDLQVELDTTGETLALQREMESLKPFLTSNRIEKVEIVAVTTDSYVSRFLLGEDRLQFRPDHIYLVDAARCPLVKALPLLATNTPLTMVGDHTQLLPNSGIPQEWLDSGKSLCLWTKPAIMLPILFDEGMDALREKTPRDLLQNPAGMDIYALKTSWRYGRDTAQALDDMVYHMGLHGQAEDGLKIVIINAPIETEVPEHTQPSHPKLIQWHIWTTGIYRDAAVLTFHENQVKLLQKRLNRFAVAKIMTIPDAANITWDTVLLSITENRDYDPYLLNAALSRANREFILVCDLAYWLKQKDTFLYRLIHLADDIQ